MSRMILLVLVAVLVGGAFLLSTLPKEQPTHPIEVAVPHAAPAEANAR